nr:MAG TPA: hypothetical protein [Caudoviricetes sp.]
MVICPLAILIILLILNGVGFYTYPKLLFTQSYYICSFYCYFCFSYCKSSTSLCTACTPAII